MVMEMEEKGKGEFRGCAITKMQKLSPERSSQCEWFGIQEKQKELTCELFFVFCLSASHPKHSNSKKQKRRPLPVVSARLVPSPLRYSGPVIRF